MSPRNRWLLVVTIAGVLAACSPTTSPSPAASAPARVSPRVSSEPGPTAAPSASAAVATPVPSASAAALPQGSEPVTLDPAQFAGVALDHPYWPMAVGSRWVYRETDLDGTVQRVEVTVTDKTKQILGITATVVHDVVTEGGAVVEDTFDWYAQDATGNLWYLGEDTKEYEKGKVVSTEGSWEAGVDGAQPGIILPADPAIGMTYRQEYYAGQAEDEAAVKSLDEHVVIPFGTFDGVLMTREFTPLEPDVVEQKFYARGVGEIQALQTSGGSSREELRAYEPG